MCLGVWPGVRVWGHWQLILRGSDSGARFTLLLFLLLCNVPVTCVVRRLIKKDVRNFLNLVWNWPCFILGCVMCEDVGGRGWNTRSSWTVDYLAITTLGFVSRTQRIWELLWQRYHPILGRLEARWQAGNRPNLWLLSNQYLGIPTFKHNLISLILSLNYQLPGAEFSKVMKFNLCPELLIVGLLLNKDFWA